MFENLMLGHLFELVAAFYANPLNVVLSLASIAVALLILLKLGDAGLSHRQRIALIYLHLGLLFAPLVFLALSLACSGASLVCAVDITRLLLYAVPLLLVAVVLACFVLLPRYYERAGMKAPAELQFFVNSESKRLGLLQPPKVFSIDSGKPIAFSLSFFRPRIFVSVGMQDVLSKKELEAVLLHELGHIKNASSWFKFSFSLLKAFSPFASMRGFGFSVGDEEKKADSCAAERQKTTRFLDSAKRKVCSFQ